MKTKEVKKGDVIYYTGKSGGASIVAGVNIAKNIFVPNKTGMNIEGERFPILKHEKFNIVSFDIIGKETKNYSVNITLTRLISGGQTFIISRDNLYKYFSAAESQF